MLQLHLLKSNNTADLATEFLLKPVIFSVVMSLFWKISILKISLSSRLNLLSANLQKWSNALKLFVGNIRRILWVCLTIL